MTALQVRTRGVTPPEFAWLPSIGHFLALAHLHWTRATVF